MERRGLVAAAVGLALAGAVLALPAGAEQETPLRAGFSEPRSIVPAALDEVYHVRGGGLRPTGTLPGDGIWATGLYLERGDQRLGIVTLDLLGFFYDDVVLVRDLVRAELGEDVQVLVTSSHTHSTVDTIGLYGPDLVTSGVNLDYQAFVREQAAAAVVDAARAAVPVSVRFGARPAPDDVNEYDRNRHPGSFDNTVYAMQFLESERVVGTLVNWSSHPELINPNDANDPDIPPGGVILSSDYVHTLRRTVVQATGAPAVFLNGAIGAVTGLGMNPIDPATGEPFPRRSVRKAYYVGEQVGLTALGALDAEDTLTVADPELQVDVRELVLDVDNEFLVALGTAGVIHRDFSAAGQPTPAGAQITSEMLRVALGPAELVTSPGEHHPDLLTGRYLPDGERANPDVPGERPILDQMTGDYRFMVGLAQDMIGYVVSATDFVPPTTVPVYGQGPNCYGRSHYQETLSIGRHTARTLSQAASELLGHEPETDQAGYRGGFLDNEGRPVYGQPAPDREIRGVWIDTSGSGWYEHCADTQLFTALPNGAPAAFGFLDGYREDIGTELTTAARGVWIDGDGDGAFDPLQDPHLLFGSYRIGKGPLAPLP